MTIDYTVIKMLNEKAESRRTTDRIRRFVDTLTGKQMY